MDKIKQLEFRLNSSPTDYNTENKNYENFENFRQKNIQNGDIFEINYQIENRTNFTDDNRLNNRYNLSSENKDEINFVDDYGENMMGNNNVRFNGRNNDEYDDINTDYGEKRKDTVQYDNNYDNNNNNNNDDNDDRNCNDDCYSNRSNVKYHNDDEKNIQKNRKSDSDSQYRTMKKIQEKEIENNFLSNICLAFEGGIKKKNNKKYNNNRNENENENKNKNYGNFYGDGIIRNVEYKGDVSLLAGEGQQNSAAAFKQIKEIMKETLITNDYLSEFESEISDDCDLIIRKRITLLERFSEAVILFIYNLLTSFSYTSIPSPFPTLSSDFTLHPSNTLFSPLPSSTSFPNTSISVVQKKKKSSR